MATEILDPVFAAIEVCYAKQRDIEAARACVKQTLDQAYRLFGEATTSKKPVSCETFVAAARTLIGQLAAPGSGP